jgi:hypothetical protein
MVGEILKELSPQFNKMYAKVGISPEEEEKEAHRRMFRLAEDHCVAAQGTAPWEPFRKLKGLGIDRERIFKYIPVFDCR